MHPLDDTIAAIASPPGGAARGIVRLSGPNVRECVEAVFQSDADSPTSAVDRPVAVAGSLRPAGLNSPMPCDLFLWPDGRSYTGQPVAEIHTLGSPPLLEAVLQTVCRAGARLAQPGEFTLRAFLAGRIDLTQAEAVLGVIDAADPGELNVALSQLAGGLAAPLHHLRDTLIDLLAHLEAGFDFADEDLPFITSEELDRQLGEAAEDVARLARQMASRGETSGAIRVVLVGWPNTGKSSLFNALTGDPGALVADQPGTTRDYLTADLDLDGVKCRLVDTAGVAQVGVPPLGGRDRLKPELQQSDACRTVDETAQATAAEQHRRAHVQVLCLDRTRPLVDWERVQLARPAGDRRVVVLTKIDARGQTDFMESAVRTSSLTGEGIDALQDAIRHAVLAAGASGAGVVASTAVRCHESLRLAAEGLRRAGRLARTGNGEELVAAEVRLALDELGKVAGAVYTDDVLDRVFGRFCIGK